MRKTVHLYLDVRGALRNMTKREKSSMFKHPDGRRMTAAEADDALMDELVKGHEVIPLHKKCANPCPSQLHGVRLRTRRWLPWPPH
jgi:hypothetical protein